MSFLTLKFAKIENPSLITLGCTNNARLSSAFFPLGIIDIIYTRHSGLISCVNFFACETSTIFEQTIFCF